MNIPTALLRLLLLLTLVLNAPALALAAGAASRSGGDDHCVSAQLPTGCCASSDASACSGEEGCQCMPATTAVLPAAAGVAAAPLRAAPADALRGGHPTPAPPPLIRPPIA